MYLNEKLLYYIFYLAAFIERKCVLFFRLLSLLCSCGAGLAQAV
jgi:hypothetical protein